MGRLYDTYCKDCKFFVPDDPQSPHMDHVWGHCSNLNLLARMEATWAWSAMREDSGCSAHKRKEVTQ